MTLTQVTVLSDNSGLALNPVTNAVGFITALDAATNLGASQPVINPGGEVFILQTIVTGSPTSVLVALEVSYDQQEWHPAVQSSSTTGESKTSGGSFPYMRANLLALTGGTDPTVSAVIAAIA